MKKITVKMLLLITFLSVLLIGVGGIAVAEDGVTDHEILVGSTMDLSGPLAFMGQNWKIGADLYFKYINDNGGVHGRKIRFIVEDDGFQAPRTVQAIKKLITKDKIFCTSMNLGAASMLAIAPLLEQYKVPMFPASTGNILLSNPPRKYIFLSETNYVLMGRLAVKYLLENMKVKNPKVAILYQEDAAGKEWLQGVQEGCQIKKLPTPLELSYKRGATDFSSQIAKCKQGGITHIFMHGNIREPAMIMKEAQRIQYKATYIGNPPQADNRTVELCGDALPYSNGYYFFSNFRFAPNDSDLYKKMEVAVKKYGGASLDNRSHQWGFSSAQLLCEVLKRSGKDLTREGFVKAAESLKKYDNGMQCPITFAPGRRDGGQAANVYQAKNGAWVSISGWIME